MENSSTSFKERFGPKFPRVNVLRLADTFAVVSRSSILYQRFLTSKYAKIESGYLLIILLLQY